MVYRTASRNITESLGFAFKRRITVTAHFQIFDEIVRSRKGLSHILRTKFRVNLP